MALASIKRDIIRNSTITGAISVAGIATSLLSQMVIASHYGTTGGLDAFWVILAIASYIPGIYSSSISDPFVVTYLGAKPTGDRTRLLNAVTTWTGLLGVVLVAIMLLGALPLVQVVAPGFSDEQRMQAQLFMLLAVALPFLMCLTSLLTNLLAALKVFTLPKVAGLVQPAVIIAAVLLGGDRVGVAALVIGTVLGYLIQTGMLLVMVRRANLALRLTNDLLPPEMVVLVRNGAPLFVAAFLGGAVVFLDRNAASILGDGAISSIGYAENIYNKIVLVLLIPLSTVVFPYLADTFTGAHFTEVMRFALRTTLLIFVPVALFSAVFAPTLLTILLQRGNFTLNDVQTVSFILRAFMLGLPLYALAIITVRGLMTVKATWATIVTSGAILLAKLFFNRLFGQYFGPAGLALLTSLIYFFTVPFLLIILTKKCKAPLSFVWKIAGDALTILLLSGLACGLAWLGARQLTVLGDTLFLLVLQLGLAFIMFAGLLGGSFLLLNRSRAFAMREPRTNDGRV